MVVLDTDMVSLVERGNSVEAQRVHAQLERIPAGELATTIISFEEQMRGWFSVVASARKQTQLVEAYRRLKRQLEYYCHIQVLDYDERAAVKFQGIRAQCRRLGTQDLKISAIVHAHDATLLSRNLRHFSQVPGLKVEDWTV